uniref:GtrA family protein n=1 Tax=Orrella sp. TaxID=1921583 RepID=UPI004048429F
MGQFWAIANNSVTLKLLEFRRTGFFAFILNGGAIGLLSWLVQVIFYYVFLNAGLSGTSSVAMSVWSAFFMAVIINFYSQRRFVFARKGFFWRFFLSTTAVITVVSGLAVLVFNIGKLFLSPQIAQIITYPISAGIMAPVSFYLKSTLVFPKD